MAKVKKEKMVNTPITLDPETTGKISLKSLLDFGISMGCTLTIGFEPREDVWEAAKKELAKKKVVKKRKGQDK